MEARRGAVYASHASPHGTWAQTRGPTGPPLLARPKALFPRVATPPPRPSRSRWASSFRFLQVFIGVHRCSYIGVHRCSYEHLDCSPTNRKNSFHVLVSSKDPSLQAGVTDADAGDCGAVAARRRGRSAPTVTATAAGGSAPAVGVRTCRFVFRRDCLLHSLRGGCSPAGVRPAVLLLV